VHLSRKKHREDGIARRRPENLFLSRPYPPWDQRVVSGPDGRVLRHVCDGRPCTPGYGVRGRGPPPSPSPIFHTYTRHSAECVAGLTAAVRPLQDSLAELERTGRSGAVPREGTSLRDALAQEAATLDQQRKRCQWLQRQRNILQRACPSTFLLLRLSRGFGLTPLLHDGDSLSSGGSGLPAASWMMLCSSRRRLLTSLCSSCPRIISSRKREQRGRAHDNRVRFLLACWLAALPNHPVPSRHMQRRR